MRSLFTTLFFAGFAGLLSAQPDLAWVRSIPGATGTEHAFPYIANDGNVFIFGEFYGTVDFDPGPGQVSLTAFGSGADIFMTKYDTLGNLLWAKRMGSSNHDVPQAVRTDTDGNFYLTGAFNGNVDFDPGTGVQTLVSSSGSTDIFVAKYDSDGNYGWAVAMGGTGNESGADIELDQAGNIYIAGRFVGPADFDPGPGVYTLTAAGSNSSTDIYFCKLTNSGGFTWAKRIGGPGLDLTNKLAVAADGTVYLCGVLNGTVDADPGPGVLNLTNNGSNDIFLGKYDTDGNLVWARSTGGPNVDNGLHAEVAADGNVLLMGTFQLTVDFDFGPGTAYRTSNGITDVFIAKYTPAGNFMWVKQMGNSTYDWIEGTSIDQYGHIYYCGYFNNTLDLDPGPGVFNVTSAGNNDGYVTKLDPDGNFIWGRSIAGAIYDYTLEVDAHRTDDVYFGGIFVGTTDFDPPHNDTLTSSGSNYDAYVARVRNCIDSNAISVTACDQYTWNGQQLTTSGSYSHRFYTPVGCDSVVTLQLTILPSTITDTTSAACGSFHWRGTDYFTSGSYTDTLTAVTGCDSILRLNLTIWPAPSSTTSIGACSSYTWHGTLLTSSGMYSDTLTTIHGCDSITYLNLSIYEPAIATLHDTACSNYTWNGTTYNSSGVYTQSFLTVHGCDSTVTLHLVILQPTFSAQSATACSSYEWFGTTFTVSGSYTHTLTNAAGCDSTITLGLTVHQPTSSVQNVLACGSFSWHGNTYTSSGNYSDTLVNAQGCDSVAFLNLTIEQAAAVSETITACSDYNWHGNMYMTSGTFTDTLGTVHGCDSIVTLNLTILQPDSLTQNETACAGFEWFGTTFTVSGNYTHTLTNAAGCDSTITLNLTILQPTASTQNATACMSYVWFGDLLTASGSYTHTLENAAGCDSTITLNLTIHSPETVSDSQAACGSFTWNGHVYTSSGSYTDTLTTIHGCDSIVTLSLVINTVDVSTTQQATELQAVQAGAAYQWLTCNPYAVIPGAAGQSFTATANGSYAVVVTQNGCADTSDCIAVTQIGLEEQWLSGISVSPNPTSGSLTIVSDIVWNDASITVLSQTGQVILAEQAVSGQVHTIDLSFCVPGVYYLHIEENDRVFHGKIVKR